MGILMRDHTASNPSFLGQDLEEIIIPAAGAGVTAYANDNVIQPVAQRVLPQVFAQTGAVGKLADAGTTYLTAEAVEWGGSFLSPRVGKLLGLGGKIVAGAKVLLAFLPNIYQFSAGLNLPNPSGVLNASGLVALPAVGAATTAAATATPAATPSVSTSTPAGPYTPVSL